MRILTQKEIVQINGGSPPVDYNGIFVAMVLLGISGVAGYILGFIQAYRHWNNSDDNGRAA